MTRMPGYPCATCRRESAGITINIPDKPLAAFCSAKCAGAWMRSEGSLGTNEPKAIEAGGNAAGAYLDGIGVFDLRQMTADQWRTFCTTLWTAACADLARQADDQIPF